MRPGLQVPEGLTGVRGFTSKMAHSHGYYLETSNFCHVGLSTVLPGCTQKMAANFPWREWSKKERENARS